MAFLLKPPPLPFRPDPRVARARLPDSAAASTSRLLENGFTEETGRTRVFVLPTTGIDPAQILVMDKVHNT